MDIKSIEIKKATEKDYPYCYKLDKTNMLEYVNKHWGGWNPKIFKKDFDPKNTKIILKNNRRIGYFVVLEKPKFWYISNIQISPRLMGKGLGSYIMKLIEKQVSKTNKPKIQLEVFKDNPAKRLYERFGYKIIEDKGSSVEMKKKL